MDANVLKGKWKELRGQVKEQWGKFTDDELDQVEGKVDQLVGLLQRRYGYAKQEAEQKVEDWLVSHFRYQIRTFWIGLFYMLIGLFTTFILIGYLFLLFTFVWWIVRCVKGIQQLDQEVEVTNTTS